ncbi:sugar ABC transporter permease [Clostridia bacterium]|nr:sugar ABC transporter permease [Clostridia bacterium]
METQTTAIKKKRRNRIRASAGERVGAAVNYIVIALLSLTFFLPFIYVLSLSLTTERAVGMYGITLFPREWTFESYIFIFQRGQRILLAFRNTIFITVAGTVLSIFVTAGMAYPLSKKKLPFRNVFLKYVLFSMLFGGGLIPYYLVVSKFLGLKGNFLGMLAVILPGAYSSWNMILMRNFFSALPDSLEEAALIDGANELLVLFKIVLPLSMPIIATISLFNAVGFWNNWYGPLLFMSNDTPTIMLFLKEVVSSTASIGESISPGAEAPPSISVQMATVMVCTLPIIMIYPFLQKHFAKGVLIGSVKG